MNRHRNAGPVSYLHVASAAPTLGGTGHYDTPENRERMERVVSAAESFEIINGRAVQVRNPATSAPLPGVPLD